MNDEQHALNEALDERAAIMEYDANLPRDAAVSIARRLMRAYKYQLRSRPEQWFVMITPGISLRDARAALKLRFGDDVRSVKLMTWEAN